jgi:hypothetical protein
MKPKELRIYKPTKDGKGIASAWQLAFKPDRKYDPFLFFLTMAVQTQSDNENARFDWDNAIVVKLGENDLGEMISVLERRKTNLGTDKGILYHQSPDGGNKIIRLDSDDRGYLLSVSVQDAAKNKKGPFKHTLTHGEASTLLILLKRAIEVIYGW